MTNPAKNTATPKTVAEAVSEKQDIDVETKTVPAQTTGGADVSPNMADGLKVEGEKLTTVQRAKAKVEKLKKNPAAMFMLGASSVIIGLAVKNNRKPRAVSVELLDVTDTTIHGVGDEPNDSF